MGSATISRKPTWHRDELFIDLMPHNCGYRSPFEDALVIAN